MASPRKSLKDSKRAGRAVGVGVPLLRRRAASAFLATLALVLLVASFTHGHAQARPLMASAEVFAVVICADGATQTILLDRNGNPVEPEHCLPELCSACVGPTLLESAPQTAVAPRWTASLRVSFPVHSDAATVLRPESDPQPRGPPVTT